MKNDDGCAVGGNGHDDGDGPYEIDEDEYDDEGGHRDEDCYHDAVFHCGKKSGRRFCMGQI